VLTIPPLLRPSVFYVLPERSRISETQFRCSIPPSLPRMNGQVGRQSARSRPDPIGLIFHVIYLPSAFHDPSPPASFLFSSTGILIFHPERLSHSPPPRGGRVPYSSTLPFSGSFRVLGRTLQSTIDGQFSHPHRTLTSRVLNPGSMILTPKPFSCDGDVISSIANAPRPSWPSSNHEAQRARPRSRNFVSVPSNRAEIPKTQFPPHGPTSTWASTCPRTVSRALSRSSPAVSTSLSRHQPTSST